MAGELLDWQQNLPDNLLHCRDFHHTWRPYRAARIKGGFFRELQCASCSSIKLQLLDEQGYILKSSYSYSEGYQRPKGSGRVTSDENARLRLLALMRSMS